MAFSLFHLDSMYSVLWTGSAMLDSLLPNAEAPVTTPQAQNWRITVSYDGTDFAGWQIQPDLTTVQGEIQLALGRVTGEAPLPQGSGRTDAGVHALGQVASFPLQARIPAHNLCMALNRTLPPAIRILDARPVRSTFHARHSSQGKTYEYRIFRGPLCPPTLARYVHACRWPLDLDRINRAAADLVGEHDFLSFAATDPALVAAPVIDPATRPLPRENFLAEPREANAIRTIYSSEFLERESDAGPQLVYRVRGSGFLHHMVRNIVGTLVDVGRGRIACDALPQILAARSRTAAGPTAPAQGLFLHSVNYNDAEFEL